LRGDDDILHVRPSLWWLDGCGVFTMPQRTVACSIILCIYLVIAFPIRRRFLALSHTEFAETRDVFDGVEAPSDAIAPRWGNRSSPFAPAKPVGRKTKLTGCFGDT
jgi:hypothetical protein